MDAGLLPVKALGRAKSRLSPLFDDDQRRAVATALLEDALALCVSAGFLEWWLVSEDPDVLERASGAGLKTVTDPGGGLNAAVAAGIEEVVAAGAESVTVIPCDVPLAYKGDLVDLVDTGATSDIVLVPSGGDGGTNALFLSPPGLIEPAFGPGSLQRHIALAEKERYRCAILSLPRLALDVDTPEDVDSFLASAGEFGGRSAELLRKLREGQAP